ncbi:MAG: hypothetical protein KGJ41_02105, partial [Rhodospirillales bacterium]|nr:hypothetical protein [Rhodospirillales bacterium]
THTVQFRTQLQGVVDSAALSAATVYVSTSTSAAATTTSANYMNAGIASLPASSGVTFTTTPTVLTDSAGQTTGYQVVVTAKASMPTTFLGSIMSTIPVSVTATALNPVIYANPTAGNFKSSAWDANKLYWYIVPSGGGIPPSSALHLMFDNTLASQPSVSFQVAASQQIGFALQNTTGGKQSYGNNQYGSTPGTTHTFYSNLSNPTNSANGYNATDNRHNVNGVNGANGNNCTLQTAVIPSSGVLPTPQSGTCFNTPIAYAAPSCTKLAGKSIFYSWNDMGGSIDDKDYNDAQFSFSCGGAGGGSATTPTTVVLTN